MTKFTDLTKEQQEHFTQLIEDYEIPEGCTHIDVTDDTQSSFISIDSDRNVFEYFSPSLSTWRYWGQTEDEGASSFYPLPSPPYYDPKETSFNPINKVGVTFTEEQKELIKSLENMDYIIDIESINEVAELIQQHNRYRCTESLHSIRKSIWQLIQKALETESWSIGSGGVVVMIGSDNAIDVLYSPCRDHKFVTINVDEIMENSYDN